MTAPAVRGSAFIGPLRHLKAAVGPEGVAGVVRDAGPVAADALAAPVRKLGWYPYATYVELLLAIDRRLGKGDFEHGRVLGVEAGRQDLGTVFKIFAALASAERLIRGCTRVWDAYYRDAGTMEATAWSPEGTILVIRDFPAMHPVHCRLMEGWMISTMENIGYRVLSGSRETECTSRGGTLHRFEARWEPSRR